MNFGETERIKFEPFEYQDLMWRWLYNRKYAALFAGMGLGKSVCTLRAWDKLAYDGASRGLLIVAPIRVCNLTWPNEVEKWDFCKWMTFANLRTDEGMEAWERGSADVYVINPEKLATKEVRRTCPECEDEPDFRPVCEECWGDGFIKQSYPGFVAKHIKGRKKHELPVDTLVIDELSLAKSKNSKRFNALRVWRDHFDRIFGLTGTPAPNSYLDLWAQIRFLDDGKRLGLTEASYKDAYFFNKGEEGRAKYVPRPGAKKIIEKKLADLCLTMLSEDWLDVPTTNYTDIEIPLPRKARGEYDEMKRELLLELEEGNIEALNAAALTNKLLQITGGAVYDADRNVHDIHDAKVKALKKLIGQHKGEPILVLTQFKHERSRILEAIPEARMFSEKGMPDWQAGKIPVWVADPRSMSHGIDGMQHGGRIAVWFTLTYSNEQYLQTNARLVRTGQSYETIVYRIIATNTVDEAVAEAIRDKGNQQQGLFAALKNLQRMENIGKLAA